MKVIVLGEDELKREEILEIIDELFDLYEEKYGAI